MGGASHPHAILIRPGLHGQVVVKLGETVNVVVATVVGGGVVTQQNEFGPLQRHGAIGFGPAAVIAQAHAHPALEGIPYRKAVVAGFKVAFFQMLGLAAGLGLIVAGQVDLAVFAHRVALTVHGDGGLVASL